MENWVIVMMIGASLILGSVALLSFLWGIKNNQFDDKTKMMNAVHFDSEEDLNDAAEKDRKKEELRKKNYRPE